ncbi:stage V sporulation protein AB [Kroppenstedtia guangzhouensis]|uniref:Stage V sporulation protein AB n=1 Tax=Kroppenstedtia guangzhouensis TaxID=1274356 RepID=A0ABQ1G965_9BACL|nr:stage V sporulation protein AB [Kroppenstedtia guangzhouensis]GGA39191.1 stage V sporulation protein AB [Kroppenstedtia guangzhouensis]
MSLLVDLALIFIGLAGGVAVGSGLVAFLTVLDIVPRLTVLTNSRTQVHLYEIAFVVGAVVFTWVDFREWVAFFPPVSTVWMGLLSGVFVGLLAAALTEVVNVLPILAKRIGMEPRIFWLLLAMMLGKVVGSLFQWIVFISD